VSERERAHIIVITERKKFQQKKSRKICAHGVETVTRHLTVWMAPISNTCRMRCMRCRRRREYIKSGSYILFTVVAHSHSHNVLYTHTSFPSSSSFKKIQFQVRERETKSRHPHSRLTYFCLLLVLILIFSFTCFGCGNRRRRHERRMMMKTNKKKEIMGLEGKSERERERDI
jgi:hypothetical protein